MVSMTVIMTFVGERLICLQIVLSWHVERDMYYPEIYYLKSVLLAYIDCLIWQEYNFNKSLDGIY